MDERLKIHNIDDDTELYKIIKDIIEILLDIEDITFSHKIADCDDETLESICSDDLLFNNFLNNKPLKEDLPIDFHKVNI